MDVRMTGEVEVKVLRKQYWDIRGRIQVLQKLLENKLEK